MSAFESIVGEIVVKCPHINGAGRAPLPLQRRADELRDAGAAGHGRARGFARRGRLATP